MKREGFTENATGRLMPNLDGQLTFVPDPLPPRIDGFGRTTVQLLAEAERRLGELAGVGRTLPNPHLLIGPFLRREAVLSSRIEGTYATAEQLLLYEALPREEPATPDVREVGNYVKALEYGLARLKSLPVSLRLIREIHGVLLQGVRGQEYTPGEFRRRQNYIGHRGQPIQDARFVPPPVTEMEKCLDQFERFLHSGSDLPFLLQLALIHYQFEAIHPFLDGNGRLGRLLISLLMSERGVLPQPLLYLSAFFEHNRDAYMDHLLAVSQRGAWIDWIHFLLRGVAEQAADATRRSQRLLDLRQQYRDRLQATPRTSALALRLVDEIFAFPALTARKARDVLQVTTVSAQRNINKLVKAGILAERTGRARNRVYVASEILSTIEAEGA